MEKRKLYPKKQAKEEEHFLSIICLIDWETKKDGKIRIIICALSTAKGRLLKMKKSFKWFIGIMVLLILAVGSMYLVDYNRMQKNQPVLFSTWGYDYTTPESEKGKTGNQAGNQTENQTENSNTSGGEPFEKEQLLTYQQGDHEMRFRLPKDWKYEILSQSGDFYEYGIRFHLADVEKNMTFYCYSNRFGVCGTGLETKMILLESGMEAEIGY